MTMTASPTTRTRGLFQHWIHSREEDVGLVEVYRPDGFDFPASFGRDGFALRPDGRFIQEEIGPADGVVRTKGRWTMDEPWVITATLEGLSTDNEPQELKFEVVTVDDSILRIIRRDEPAQGPVADAEQAVRLDFDRARIITRRTFPPQHVLQVVGNAPSADTTVELVPLVYVQQPDYWEVEIIGRSTGVATSAIVDYEVTLPVSQAQGRFGIEVVGTTHTKRLDIPGSPANTSAPQASQDVAG